MNDLLAMATWLCASTTIDAVTEPRSLESANLLWLPAAVPGTAASALRSAGRWCWGESDRDALDGRDWWFRCEFAADSGDDTWLECDGLATGAEVWLNDGLVATSDNMWLAHRTAVTVQTGTNQLAIRFAALDAVLKVRRPRPRWRSKLPRDQNLRWCRTALPGRIAGWADWAAPVGPWRPVRLTTTAKARILERHLRVSCEDGAGHVGVRLDVATARPGLEAEATVGGTTGALEWQSEGGEHALVGELQIPAVERWWPHTHGEPVLYPVTVTLGEETFDLGHVGFRSVEIDRSDGGFSFVVNGERIFCRGACWVGPDVVSLNPGEAAVRRSLELLRDAGMNMVRVGGYSHYQDSTFFDLCDELGILVWQDCMLASYDPPEDDDWLAGLSEELTQVLGALSGRPSLALVCGSSETYQQAAMFGLDQSQWSSRALDEVIPDVVARVLPDTEHLVSAPSGGNPAFDPREGVAHYFGVGAYLRPLEDARRSAPRFAAECLAFATPPEPATVEEVFGSDAVAGHDPRWKSTVARDSATSWDFEDVVDAYVEMLFALDPRALRWEDPERHLEYQRATVAEIMTATFTEWRRAGSTCAGGLVLSWQDLWPGAGWGLLDAFGRPKAPWFALRRTLAPLAVLLSDEGLSGLQVHVVNDRPEPWAGRLRLQVFNREGVAVEDAVRAIEVAGGGRQTVGDAALLGGFRDLTYTYRFGPRSYDIVRAVLEEDDSLVVSEATYLPGGRHRPLDTEVGLAATARRTADSRWEVVISTRRMAQGVALDVPGWLPSDSWFHLAPGITRTVSLVPDGSVPGLGTDRLPAGSRVRALNAAESVTIGRHDA